MKKKIAVLLWMLFTLAAAFWPVPDAALVHLSEIMQPLSAAHLLGTDNLGRDLFALMMKGCTRTLLVVVLSTAISLVLGTAMGLAAGYWGKGWALLITFVADFTLVVPSFILALIVAALFGLTPLTERMRRRAFVESEIALGIPGYKILYRHILPNILRPLLAFLSGKAGGIAIQYAALTYIGLGCDISNPDWGTMLYQYRGYLLTSPRLVLLPAGAIFLLALFFRLFLTILRRTGRRGRCMIDTVLSVQILTGSVTSAER